MESIIFKTNSDLIEINKTDLENNIINFISDKKNPPLERATILYWLKRAAELIDKYDKSNQQQAFTEYYNLCKTHDYNIPNFNNLQIIEKKNITKCEYSDEEKALLITFEIVELEDRIKELKEQLKPLEEPAEITYSYYFKAIAEPKKKLKEKIKIEEF